MQKWLHQSYFFSTKTTNSHNKISTVALINLRSFDFFLGNFVRAILVFILGVFEGF